MFLKRLDRYIISEIIPYFFIGLFLYAFALLTSRIFELTDLLIKKSAGFIIVVKLFGFLLPEIISISLPMSFLFAVLLAMSRLSIDSEYLAFRSLGISLRRLIKPVLYLAIVIFIMNIILTFYIVPSSNYNFTKEIVNMILINSENKIKPREFITDIPGFTIYIHDKTQDNIWEQVLIKDNTNKNKDKLILADTGELIINKKEKKAYIRLQNAVIHFFDKNTPEEYNTGKFKSVFKQPIRTNIFKNLNIAKSRRDKTFPEIIRDIKLIKIESFVRSYKCELNKRVSLPFASLVFAILGVGLGLSIKRGGFGLSLIIIVIYYLALTAGENFAIQGHISPFLGLWLPDIVFLVLGLYLIRKGIGKKIFNLRISFIKNLKRKKIRFKKKSSLKKTKSKKLKLKLPTLFFKYPRILDRYVIKLYIKVFLIVFISILSIFIIVIFFELIDDILENQKSMSLLVKYLWFSLPQSIKYCIPISALASTLVSFGIMYKNNELLAVKSLGISIYRLSINLLLIGLFLSALSFGLQEKILPYSNNKANNLRNEIMNRVSLKKLPFKNWMISNNSVFYRFKHFDNNKKIFENLEIIYFNNNYHIKKRILAKRGHLNKKNLNLNNGWIYIFKNKTLHRQKSFEKTNIKINENEEFFTSKKVDPELMNFSQLYDYIKFLKENNYLYKPYEVDLYFKIAFPLINIVLIFFSIPFSLKMGRSGTLAGVGLSIAIAFIYWIGLGIFKSIGTAGYISPLLAAMGINLLFFMIGLYLMFDIKT